MRFISNWKRTNKGSLLLFRTLNQIVFFRRGENVDLHILQGPEKGLLKRLASDERTTRGGKEHHNLEWSKMCRSWGYSMRSIIFQEQRTCNESFTKRPRVHQTTSEY